MPSAATARRASSATSTSCVLSLAAVQALASALSDDPSPWPPQWTASPLLACLTNYVDSLPVKEKAGWIVPSEHQSLLADALGRSSRTHRHSG
jgi:hypothetical protein